MCIEFCSRVGVGHAGISNHPDDCREAIDRLSAIFNFELKLETADSSPALLHRLSSHSIPPAQALIMGIGLSSGFLAPVVTAIGSVIAL
jgi:hypothetical protein